MDDHFGVARRREDGALAAPARRLISSALMRLPLWASASGPQRVLASTGCAFASTVLPVVRVARVADGHVTRQLVEDGFVEGLGYQSHTAVGAGRAVVVERHDARALLAAMLQRIDAQVRDARRIRHRRHSHDPAHVATPPSSGPDRRAAFAAELRRNRCAAGASCPTPACHARCGSEARHPGSPPRRHRAPARHARRTGA